MKNLPIFLGILLLIVTGAVVTWQLMGEEPTPSPKPTLRVSEKAPEEPAPSKARVASSSPTASRNTPSSSESSPRPEISRLEPKTIAPAANVEITGVVKDSEGGLPDLRVILISADSPKTLIAEGKTSSLEHAEGQFTFTVPATTGLVRVALIADSWAVSASESFDTRETRTEPATPLTVNAELPGELAATVRGGSLGNLQPLEGATITVPSHPLLSALLGHYQTYLGTAKETSGTGKLTVQAIPPGTYTFVASKQGYTKPAYAMIGTAEHALEYSTSGNSREATFTLTQSGALRGRAVLENGNTPVPGAKVDVSPVLGEVIATAYTGDDGTFEFAEIPVTMVNRPRGEDNNSGITREQAEEFREMSSRATGLTIRVSKAEAGLGEKTGIRVVVGETTDAGDILVKQAAAIFGRVTTAKGEPVEGATVQLSDGGLSTAFGGGGGMGGMLRGIANMGGVSMPKSYFSAITDADGRYRIDPVKPSPAPAEPVDPANPAADPAGPRARFQMGGRNEATASKSGFVTANQPVEGLLAAESREVNFTLQLSGAIVGTVMDDAGRPVVGVRVMALPGEAARFAGMASSFLGAGSELFGGALTLGVATGEDGSYRIENLDPASYSVVASHPKYNRAQADNVTVAAATDTPVNFTLSSGSTIFGVYYDDNGKPKPGATVTCLSVGTFSTLTAKTDANGAFEFNGLGPATYTLKGSSGDAGANPMAAMMRSFTDMNPKERVKVGDADRVEHNVYDTIPGTTTIRGTVTLDGTPYQGVLSVGGGSFSGVAFRQVNTDAEGKFEMKNVELGSYAFMLGSPMSGMGGGRRGASRATFSPLQQIRVRAEQTPYQDAALDFVTVTLRGVIVMANGTPIPDDTIVFANPVEVRDNNGSSSAWEQVQSQLTEQQRPNRETGEFAVSNLAPGTYWLTARSKTGGFVRLGPITATQDVNGLRFTLDGGVGRIAATVENFIALDDSSASMMSFMNTTGVITIEDVTGEALPLGSLSGNSQNPDNSVQIRPEGDSGIAKFERDGIPVGTWNITFQVNNYAPVTVKNVVITKDAATPVRFVLAAGGDVVVQITNNDLGVDAAQQLRYTIRDSRGAEYKKRFTFLDLMTNMFNPPDPSKQNTFVLKGFPPDTYTFTLELPGYESATAKVTVFSNQESYMPVTFKKK